MREACAIGNWGRLPSSEQNDEECDATDDDSNTEAGPIKIKTKISIL
jgi:hypothetical protein